MEWQDLLLGAVVLLIAFDILNNSDWGGGKRARSPHAWLKS
jgi:hypothetical protein